MARLNARWLNFYARGQIWYRFWQDGPVETGGAQNITGAGNISTAEVVSQPAISSSIVVAGNIPTAELAGQPAISVAIASAGNIAGAEALGQPAVLAVATSAGNISSTEAVSQPALSVSVAGAGSIASAEIAGQPEISATVTGVGEIASAEVVGQPELVWVGVGHTITDAGNIVTSEAFGEPTVTEFVDTNVDPGPIEDVMATSVNIFFSNYRLGTNVTIQRRLLDVTVNYIDNAGQPQTVIETVTFPDILALVPVEFRDDLLKEIALRLLRAKAGIDA